MRLAERACPHCGDVRHRPGSIDARALRAVATAATFGMIGTYACAAYGVATTNTGCDDPSRTCASCQECATGAENAHDADDAGSCAAEFELCFGDDRDCSEAGESDCCAFTACRAACDDAHGPLSSDSWKCICGSSGPETCFANPPEGTCAAEHPEGALRTLGAEGWQTCAYAVCEQACRD
jgi:hypothetical protein